MGDKFAYFVFFIIQCIVIQANVLPANQVTITSTCSDTSNSASKQIFYPSTNVLIQRPKNCSWSISVPEDRVVILEIIALNLSDQSSLRMYDGPDADSDVLESTIVSKHDTIESSGRNIHLTYFSTTDNDIDYFRIAYKHSDFSLVEDDILEYDENDDYDYSDDAIRITNGSWDYNLADGTFTIPYMIDNNIDNITLIESIRRAISEFHNNTCIRFFEEQSVPKFDYIFFKNSIGLCRTKVGKVHYKNKQIIRVGGCESFGKIVHEVMHKLGFYHEHTRLDRDDYIEVDYDKIKKYEEAINVRNVLRNYLRCDEFDKTLRRSRRKGCKKVGKYDGNSIMHYPLSRIAQDIDQNDQYFDRVFNILTLKDAAHALCKGGRCEPGQRNGLSSGDISDISTLYKSTCSVSSSLPRNNYLGPENCFECKNGEKYRGDIEKYKCTLSSDFLVQSSCWCPICQEIYRDCLTECQKQEEAYVNATHTYFNTLSPLQENNLRKIMAQSFSPLEQEIETKRIIKDCAENKLDLNHTNLPFGWEKGSRCEGEVDILGTWQNMNANCSLVWHNLRDRMKFYEDCLKAYNITDYHQKGKSASDKLLNFAFELHKQEKQTAGNRIKSGGAMIASGILAGIGVLLTPIANGESISLTASSLNEVISTHNDSFAAIFGENPVEYINSTIKELKDLRNEGNSLSALLIHYMISHEDLQYYLRNNNQYMDLVRKYKRDVETIARNMFSGLQPLNLAHLSQNMIPEAAFSRSTKELDEILTPYSLFRRSISRIVANMKSNSPATKNMLPRLLRKSNAIKYLNKVSGFPALASRINVGLDVWEVFEGKKNWRKGMYHHVKLATRKTQLIGNEITEAYVHIFNEDIDKSDLTEELLKEEKMYVVYVHVLEDSWGRNSGINLRFDSNGKQCTTNSIYEISNGWVEYDTRKELGNCHRFKIVNGNLAMSIISQRNSLANDIVIDAVEVSTDGRFLPSFEADLRRGIRISATHNNRIYKLRQITNRLVKIKTHTSTLSYPDTDGNMIFQITYTPPTDGDDEDSESISSEIVMNNPNVDNSFKLGLSNFLDSHPNGEIANVSKEGEIRVRLKTENSGAGFWNVDWIKFYFLGLKSKSIFLLCHNEDGEKSDGTWYEFSCKLHRPDFNKKSLKKLGISVCDKTHAGSLSNRIQLKLCQNAKDFSSDHDFNNAVATGRCCKTNYFSGSYTRNEITYIDGNTLNDDVGEKLGKCEGFLLDSGPLNLLVENDDSDAVCFDNIRFYSDDVNGMTFPMPVRTCNIANLWAEGGLSKIENWNDCTDYYYRSNARSRYKCNLNSKISLSSLKLGICDRNYAASYDTFDVTLCDKNYENCCTTNNINTDKQFNSYGLYTDGSYIKEVNPSILGNCKDKLLSETVTIFIDLKGSDGLCIDYFELGEHSGGTFNQRTSTICQHSEVHADSNQVSICPRDIRYDKIPVHCPSTEENSLQRINVKVSDSKNAGTSVEINVIFRNTDDSSCETGFLRVISNGYYQEFLDIGEECKTLKVSNYVHVWVATKSYNDDLYLTHLYLDVADKNGTIKQMACVLDQGEEFSVIMDGTHEKFGIPLKCM